MPDAEITGTTSTTVSNDRNLIGRFTTQTFTVPRLTRVQNYCIRMYDAAAKYSRYTTLLHVDIPY